MICRGGEREVWLLESGLRIGIALLLLFSSGRLRERQTAAEQLLGVSLGGRVLLASLFLQCFIEAGTLTAAEPQSLLKEVWWIATMTL